MNVFLKNEWFFDFLALKTFSERSSVDLRTQELEFGHSVLTLAFRKSCFMAWKTGRTLCAFYCTTCFQIVKVYFNTLSHFSNSEIFQVYYFKLRCNTGEHHTKTWVSEWNSKKMFWHQAKILKGWLKSNNDSETLTKLFFDLKQRIKMGHIPNHPPTFSHENNTRRRDGREYAKEKSQWFISVTLFCCCPSFFRRELHYQY